MVRSGHLGDPPLLSHEVIGPTLAAAGQMDTLRNQSAVELTGELREAIRGDPVTEVGRVMQALRLRLLLNTGSLNWSQASTDSMHPSIAYTCTSRLRDDCQLGGPMAAKRPEARRPLRVSENCVCF